MPLKWLHLTILYQLRVTYLFLRIRGTWQEQLKAIVVFSATEKLFHLIGMLYFIFFLYVVVSSSTENIFVFVIWNFYQESAGPSL